MLRLHSERIVDLEKLYEKMGFVYNGERIDYYSKGDNAILYILEL